MKAGYFLGEFKGKTNHLLFMDDSKLYGETLEGLNSLVQTEGTFSSDKGMQFWISKCAMYEMERGKVVQSEGIELANGETIKSLEDEKGR